VKNLASTRAAFVEEENNHKQPKIGGFRFCELAEAFDEWKERTAE
jgi:hypothetical protein